MNRTQLEHIIRASSQISGDTEIVVIGSQAIHAQDMKLPPVAFQSGEADVYPLNHPERAEEIDAAIGELSQFHKTYGYYAHGVSPKTAILAPGWEQRVVRLSNENTNGATGLCLNIHDLVVSKFAAGREKDREFNSALIQQGCVDKTELVKLANSLPVGEDRKLIIMNRITSAFAPLEARPPSQSHDF